MSGRDAVREILRIEGLHVRYAGPRADHAAVTDASLSVGAGEFVSLVGASGSGKSTVLGAVARLLPGSAEVTARALAFEGTAVLDLTRAQMRRLRGRGVGMIFQDPRASLNPVMRVGAQIAEAARVQRKLGRRAAWRMAVARLERVGMPRPEVSARAFPHTLSGGMCQRVLIAMALVGEPRLLLADEPTTALDVTTQAGILDLLRSLREETGMAVLLVTHDLRVVNDIADRVVVLDKGRVVETAATEDLIASPGHPASARLVDAMPHLGARKGPILRTATTVNGGHPIPAGRDGGES